MSAIFEYLYELQTRAFENAYDLIPDSSRYKDWFKLFCPICGELSMREKNDFKVKILHYDKYSIEHVPPQYLGGKELCLTHEKCNNDFGTLEGEFTRQKMAALGKFDWRHKAKIITDTGYVPCDFDLSSNTNMHIAMKGNPENPNIPKITNSLGNSSEITLNLELYNLKRLRVSILKSGFLILFIRYGHKLVTQSCFKLIIEQLRQPNKSIIEYPGFFVGDSLGDGICYIDSIPAISVVFNGYISLFPVSILSKSLGLRASGISKKLKEIWSGSQGAKEYQITGTKISDLPQTPTFELDYKFPKEEFYIKNGQCAFK